MTDKERNADKNVAASQSSSNIPTISVPKGGGAIRGIGEKFAANPVTGTGSLSVPIFTSPGRSGFGPQLSLSYDSGSGNGPFGFGWNLSLPSITRKTDKGLPRYMDAVESDVFILSGAEDLVPVFKKGSDGNFARDSEGNLVSDEDKRDSNGNVVSDEDPNVFYLVKRYRPRIEGLFALIERWTRKSDGDIHWRSISKDNILTVYGRDEQSRIYDPADNGRIFNWLICESYDDKGNAIIYKYKAEDDYGIDLSQANECNRFRTANRYIKRILYGNRQPLLLDITKPSFRKSHTEQIDFSYPDAYPNWKWMFELVFDYGEDHYKRLGIDETMPPLEQHQLVQASALDNLDPNAASAWPSRPDPFSIYRSGFEVRTYRRCQRILMFHRFPELGSEPYLVRSTEFDYSDLDYTKPVGIEIELRHKGSTRFASFIRAVTQSGYVQDKTKPVLELNGAKYLTYIKKSLPPLEFDYSQATIQEDIIEADIESLENLPIGLDGSSYRLVDLDGEGLSGILTEQAEAWFYKPNLGGGRFGPMEKVALKPSLAALNSGRQQLLDLAGDGQLDVMIIEGSVSGFYERTKDRRWENFNPFNSIPNVVWNDPNMKFVDLTGDGHADIMIAEDQVFTWYPSLAEDGFGPAERVHQALDEVKGPRLVFNDGTQSIHLADMSGDNLTDLVRIRNGEVCYWPNLGYGRFGAKVTMDNAPWFDSPDQFDQRRIRLADIDGSGATDIIYLKSNGIEIYFNHSGNSWSSVRKLLNFPHIDDLSAIQMADLFGNGTACLVWSSPLTCNARRPLHYIDLMGGQKPHLLISSKNNLGAETWVSYVASTKFYLKDKANEKPWVTRLPFPVHVVERVETYDRISRNRFVTRYAYHHGYFDGIEREFRGFGMVEQWDTEEIGAVERETTGLEDTNWDAASFVPPMLTRSWFHTGAYFEDGSISKQFEDEYYHEGDPSLDEGALDDEQLEAMLLPDTVLPEGLTAEEAREACRSLKGSLLRQEVYALDRNSDGTPKEESDRPYLVSENNYTIKILQPQGQNKHAVFFVHPCEAIGFHYERKLYDVTIDGLIQKRADPRVTHAMTLLVDDFGNPLQSASISYGRRYDDPDPSLTEDDRKKQKPMFKDRALVAAIYTENSYTNPINDFVEYPDAFRSPLPCEARTYELLQLTPDSNMPFVTNLLRFSEVFDKINGRSDRGYKGVQDGEHDIPYEDIKATGIETDEPYRRIIEHVRTLYRSSQLDRLLPLGEIDPLALPGESYKLAFTPGLLAAVFQRERNPDDFENLLPDPSIVLGSKGESGGGYIDFDGNGNWWIPSGQVFYSPSSTDTPVQELDYASQHFFLLQRYRDPFYTDGFNTEAFVSYDAYDLLLQETRDALGNRVTVGERDHIGNLISSGNDYRVLQPRLVSDPNRNQTEVAFDTLGMVVGTAVMGKPLPAPVEGDTLTGFVADLTQTQLDAFFDAADLHATATGLLRDATMRIVYDLDRFRRTRKTSPNDPTKWQPACAATLAREIHVSTPLPPQGLKIQLSFSYSDGFGREIQKKIQAEPGSLDVHNPQAPIVNPRWVGSGWTIFNNKGKPIRQYEPFFDDTHAFKFAAIYGVSPVLFYDPAERVIATLHPNHTYEKVVFDPWQQTTYDVNDTCAPRNQQTGDPRTDPDIGGYVAEYFKTQPATWQTWHAQRVDGILGPHESNAAQRAAEHADTPTTAHFDTLGRPFLTFARNRIVCPAHDLDGTEDNFATRVELDIEGNQRVVWDERRLPVNYLPTGAIEQRIVMRYAYDMLGNRIHQFSMEAGARWMLNDVAGKPIRAWDSRGHNFTTKYDALRRPIEQTVRGTFSDPDPLKPNSDPRTLNRDILVDKIEYGEGIANSEALNLRTRIYRHFDSAGVATNARLDANGNPTEAYDFKGNLLHSTRRLARNYTAVPNWLLPAEMQLEAEFFEGSTLYDALNRPIQSIAPHSSLTRPDHPNKFNVIQPVFNEANLLERVDVWLERGAEPSGLLDPANEAPSPVGVADIDYDAKGQRMLIDYKTRDVTVIRTTYTYDPETFLLMHLYTRRGVDPKTAQGVAFTEDCDNPNPPPPLIIAAPEIPPDGKSCGLQNLHYTYDPAGNITYIQDDAQQTIYFKKRVEPSNDFFYDALYRLIQATGREHLGQNCEPLPHSHNDAGRIAIQHPNDGKAMGCYIERYVYDAVGNLLQMRHNGSDSAHAGWRRAYDYLELSLIENGSGGASVKISNRLTRTTLHPDSNSPHVEKYLHDAHGNMVRTPHLGGGLPEPNMHWDYKDQLRQTDLGVGGTAFYVYDASGQRVRKVWEKAPTLIEERIYLGGFEIFRKHGCPIGANTATLERETLHVMDDKQRIAMVETRMLDKAGNDQAPRQLIRYQFGNHLGSASLELDEKAKIVSYEEYAPYGSSTYQAVRSQTETPKRYRYTGKERDEESGLYYYGARYYAPWLGRWTACDPAGEEEGPNLYQYCFGNPTGFVDPDGQSGKKLAIVMHNESKPAGKELPEPKEPEMPQKRKIKAPGKNPSDKEKAKYEKDKIKAKKAFDESMRKYEEAKKKFPSLLKKYKENKKLWHDYRASQNEYKASEAALKAEGYDVVTVDSGKALLDALKNAGAIKELVVLAHGTPFGLGGEGPGTGLFTENPPGGATFDAKRGAKLSDLEKMINDKKIAFEKDATIVLGGCRTAGGKEGTHVGQSTWTGPIEDTFAYQLAKITGLEVFGSEGVSSYGGADKYGGDDKRTKPTPLRYSDIRWHRFTQQSNTINDEILKGKYLNVVTRKTSEKPK